MMKTLMIVFSAVLMTAGCSSRTTSKKPDDVNEAIDKAVVMGADIPPAKRGLVVRMLRINEKDLLLGLRTYADLSGGRFPTSLDTKVTLQEVETNRLGENLKDTPKSQKDQMLQDIFFATVFYDKLNREKRDALYHGDSVTRQDAGRVLVSWTESKQRYRVVYGDLKAETVSAKQFAQLSSPQ